MEIKNIKKRIANIEKLKEELKITTEAINNALANDSGYQQAVSQAKESNGQKKRLRDEILGQSENQEFVSKSSDIKQELSTLEELLAHELMEYSTHNNTDMIEGDDGFVRKFKIFVRLLPGRGYDGQQGNDSYLNR